MNDSFELLGRRLDPADEVRRRIGHWFDFLLLWDERRRERQKLLAMDNARLKDIGISRADAAAEAAKPFWRA